MEIQQRISQQRVRHVIDSYMLRGTVDETDAFDAYIDTLLSQYPQGLVELALVETLVKNWLTIPMEKGVAFLTAAHDCIQQWQSTAQPVMITPSQFSQITGLDAHATFYTLVKSNERPIASSTQAAVD